ncbi:YidH family protein [Mycolicibacterium cosmeticum]|uniref:YidH family protein n=1 Tax=Mycolicibacterium cosmeticum TaxID=258533 RepID=UPI003204F77D
MTVPAMPAARPSADGGAEPDYRFTLANERTFLAWIRTALALIAGGVAVAQLLGPFTVSWGRRGLATALIAAGAAVAAASVRRWRRVQQAMRADADLPATHLPAMLTGFLLIIGAAVLTLAVLAG